MEKIRKKSGKIGKKSGKIRENRGKKTRIARRSRQQKVCKRLRATSCEAASPPLMEQRKDVLLHKPDGTVLAVYGADW